MHIMSMKVVLACHSCASCSSTPSKHCGADLPLDTNLRIGSQNNIVYGTQLNDFSHNNPYGDDKQSDTNFPLARPTCANAMGNTCIPGTCITCLRMTTDWPDPTCTLSLPGTSGSRTSVCLACLREPIASLR
jgi:hypothetical protein